MKYSRPPCFYGCSVTFLISCTSKKEVNYDLVIQSATIVDTYSGNLNENQSIAVIGDSIAAIMDDDSAKIWTAKKEVDA